MTHYNDALNPEKFNIPACRRGDESLKTTTDKTKVTCKNCQKRLGMIQRVRFALGLEAV